MPDGGRGEKEMYDPAKKREMAGEWVWGRDGLAEERSGTRLYLPHTGEVRDRSRKVMTERREEDGWLTGGPA